MLNTTLSQPRDGLATVQGYVTTWKDDKQRQKISLPRVGLPTDSILAPGGGILQLRKTWANGSISYCAWRRATRMAMLSSSIAP